MVTRAKTNGINKHRRSGGVALYATASLQSQSKSNWSVEFQKEYLLLVH